MSFLTVLSAPALAADWNEYRKLEWHKALFEMYKQQKKSAEAEEELKILMALQPREGKWEFEYGALLHRDGKLAEAQPHYFKAAELDPENENYLGICGDFLMWQKNKEEALKYYDRAGGKYKAKGDLYKQYVQALIQLRQMGR